MLAFSLESVLRIWISLSDVVPNTSFLSDLVSDKNFLILGVSGSELSFSDINILQTCFNRHLSIPSEHVLRTACNES